MKVEDLPMEGKPTHEEAHFTGFLMEGISHYISQKPTDRRVLIAAISKVCQILFCEQTPLPVKRQCQEIDDFCNHLKKHALRGAIRS